MNYQAFASEMSFLVLERQRAERDGREVPKVKAPTEKPARFDAYPVVTARRESGQIVSWL